MKKVKSYLIVFVAVAVVTVFGLTSNAATGSLMLKVSCVENVTFSCGLTGRVCGTSVTAIAQRVLALDAQLCD